MHYGFLVVLLLDGPALQGWTSQELYLLRNCRQASSGSQMNWRKGSVSSALSLKYVRGPKFTTASVSMGIILRWRKLTLALPRIRAAFVVATIRLQNPPHQGAKFAENFLFIIYLWTCLESLKTLGNLFKSTSIIRVYYWRQPLLSN